jgi:glycosyltransferase involved in cell wall biosynthesis
MHHAFKILTEEDRRHIFIRNEWIPSNEIHDLFMISKFLVLPYIDASQNGVLSLSYTFSKPVIVSRAGSFPQYVEHGKTGFIFDVNNNKQLTNYIIQLYDDQHLCTEMGNGAYQKLCDQMSLENRIYESIQLRKH